MRPNPYLTVDGCVSRLYKQWQKHPKLIVAVDFDSTISPLDTTEEDIDYSDTINVLKRAAKHNFFIVVYSCSNTERYTKIRDHFKKFNIEVAAINSNIIDLGFEPQVKIYYNILIDDKAGLAQSIEILNRLIDKVEETVSI